MANTGYFDSVIANLKATVGAQMSGVVFETSANALDTGLKAATALGGLADNVSEAAVLPVSGGVVRSFAYDNIGRLVDARASRFPRRVEGGFPCAAVFCGRLSNSLIISCQLSYKRVLRVL